MAPTVRIHDLAEHLGVSHRSVRYLFESGCRPPDLDPYPGIGNPREMTPAQAYWIALAALLRQAAMPSRLITTVVQAATTAGWEIADANRWDLGFRPFRGRFETCNRWSLDLGDFELVRLVTTANPRVKGLYLMPWRSIARGGRIATVHTQPAVMHRVDLVQAAIPVRECVRQAPGPEGGPAA